MNNVPAVFTAGPTLAVMAIAAETMAAKAAAMLLELLINIVMSFLEKFGLRRCVGEDVSYFAQGVPVLRNP